MTYNVTFLYLVVKMMSSVKGQVASKKAKTKGRSFWIVLGIAKNVLKTI